MTEIVKNQYWDKLFRLYIEYNKTLENGNNMRFTMLLDSIKTINNTLSSKVKNDILKVDVNNTTNNMIDDIVGSFQNIMGNKSNPFDNIMNITTMISDKYKNQLQNGEIQLDKIIGGIDGVIPGLMKKTEEKKEPVIIDENFSTDNVNVGEIKEEGGNNFGNMMKMIPNMGGLMNMVSRINKAENDTDLVDIKKDMDTYLEKELKVDMSQFNETMSNIEKNMNN
jgi:predicted ATPase with chaperone activity